MLRLWSRRGLGPWLALLMVGFLLWSIVTNRPWRLEFDWGLRYLAASVYVFIASGGISPVNSARIPRARHADG